MRKCTLLHSTTGNIKVFLMISCPTCSCPVSLPHFLSLLWSFNFCNNGNPKWGFPYLKWPSPCTRPLLFLWKIRSPSPPRWRDNHLRLNFTAVSWQRFAKTPFPPLPSLGGAFKDYHSGFLTCSLEIFHSGTRKVLPARRPMPRANINIYNSGSKLVLNPT